MSRDMALAFGITDPPEVPVVRWVLPEEVDDLVTECVREQGFTIGADGSRSAPPEQQGALRLADYTCMMQYPPKMDYVGPLRSEQIGAQYDWTVQFLVPCLKAFGVEVTDVPSRTKFVADWQTSTQFRPYSQIPVETFSPARYAELEDACPQNGPSEVIRGGQSLDEWLEAHPIPTPSAGP